MCDSGIERNSLDMWVTLLLTPSSVVVSPPSVLLLSSSSLSTLAEGFLRQSQNTLLADWFALLT